MPAKGETPNPETLRKAGDDVRAKIVAAIPKQAYAAPKKRAQAARHREPARHVAQHDSAHQRDDRGDGKDHRGVGGEFNNDLDNLKYPKIKEYDARVPEQHRRGAPGRTRPCARGSRGS